MRRNVKVYIADTITCVDVAPAESLHRAHVVTLADYDALLVKARTMQASLQGVADAVPDGSEAAKVLGKILGECLV